MSTEDMEDPPGLDGEAPARGEDDQDSTLLAEWAAFSVDWLTEACLGPQVREILERWREGSDEEPWNDAAPDSGKSSSDEEGQAALWRRL